MRDSLYYLLCNHWSQCGIGFAFPSGWYDGKHYQDTFSAVYTINKMLDAADDYPGLKVSMELDVYAYEAVAKEDPACLERLKAYIELDKAALDGGTYGQPFGQDYGWESNIRQLTYGRRVLKTLLDYDAKAFLVEEQWFHPQLPQLLLKSGFQYASLQNQNSGQVKPMKDAMILWTGLDGSGIPTIPANDLMVSCVRQYTDYSEYTDTLAQYSHPLLFQWVEVWPPGMDWGASCKPFEPAIRQILEWGARPVSLAEYFELELPHRDLRPEYISSDESNYVNSWYQNGGWGFDGDRVIVFDRLAERSLLTLETIATITHQAGGTNYPDERFTELWKWLLILQNHDSSVARSYRLRTPDGLDSTAGSFVVQQYKDLMTACDNLALGYAHSKRDGMSLWNTSGVDDLRTIQLQLVIPEELREVQDIVLTQAQGTAVPWQTTQRNATHISGYAVLQLPAVGATVLSLCAGQDTEARASNTCAYGSDWMEDDKFRIEWLQGTWTVRITDKRSDQVVEVQAFSGSISKQNEHDGQIYPALSAAHKVFTFAFDGTTHAPDQLSRIRAHVQERGPLRSTLTLRSDLLTLHTTDTPVAFVEARISLEHITDCIECELYLYTGIYLSINAETVFSHNVLQASYFRDFPFGEERTEQSDFSTTTYIRVNNGERGFTLVHAGTQKIHLDRHRDGGEIRNLISRGRVLGEYEWKFAVHFGPHQPHDSARYVQRERMQPRLVAGASDVGEFLRVGDPRVMLSALHEDEGRLTVRLVNYSSDCYSTDVVLANNYSHARTTNFHGEGIRDVAVTKAPTATSLTVAFQPWEIVTLDVR